MLNASGSTAIRVRRHVSMEGTTHRRGIGERKPPKRWRWVGVSRCAHGPMARYPGIPPIIPRTATARGVASG
ncbi:MAG: hypothetical protein M0Z54_03420 [Thermaerobacter sp.]|nr:hypothetical protein [Thermaerobacter sp.]